MERGYDEPGTYRSAAGALVHVRRRSDGRLIVDHEAPRRGGQLSTVVLTKLSDDPDWPDLDLPAPLGAAFFD